MIKPSYCPNYVRDLECAAEKMAHLINVELSGFEVKQSEKQDALDGFHKVLEDYSND